jgi:hypothetical protein
MLCPYWFPPCIEEIRANYDRAKRLGILECKLLEICGPAVHRLHPRSRVFTRSSRTVFQHKTLKLAAHFCGQNLFSVDVHAK